MAKGDQEHFEQYTLQNQIKHQILQDYFQAYMQALKGRAGAFHYIDGFAGGGSYGGSHPGSPLIATELLSDQSRPWTASFVESDRKLFQQLSDALEKHQHKRGLSEPLFLRHGEFAQYSREILGRDIYLRYRNVATFAFIDPCGVLGVRLSDIAEILSKDYGECLLFWNYDGINRWLGAVAAGTHKFEGLLDLFGTAEVARNALTVFEGTKADKERELRDLFFDAVRQHSRSRFLLPFRFEARDSSRTSHYLVHCSNDGLAFKIMKHVMNKASASDQGLFELLNDADTTFQMGMFRPHVDRARDAILDQLRRTPSPVFLFMDTWVKRPHDLMTSDGYRNLLLELEKSGEIEVLDQHGRDPKPAAERRMIRGKPTLGERYIIRLRRQRS